jgi:hypothetical protein
MKITLEQIDDLKRRANVGYKDAKEALEKFDGDLVEALAYLDGEKKIKSGNITGADVLSTCKNVVSKGNKIKLKITKNESTILNLPLTLVIIIGIITMPLTIASIVLAIFTGCKIRFIKENGESCSINKHIEKATIIVNETAQKVAEDIKNA